MSIYMNTITRLLLALPSLLLLAVSLFGATGTVFAADSVNQDVILEPGWNIVSTPKVLASHSFSAAETAENFDIYVLDASETTGWATMADLGQTEFTPLFGYFIKNKTGIAQTLTFVYDTEVEPGDKIFDRAFPTAGWYSIGVANDEYAKDQTADRTDTDNPSRVLSLLAGKYDLVIDFTDAAYAENRMSVALTDPWKAAVPADIDNLDDFRETKGYAVYITEAGASYNGFQNDAVTEPVVSELRIEESESDPDATIFALERDESVTTMPFVFELDPGESTEDSVVTVIEINATSTTALSNYVDDARLLVDGVEVVSEDVSVSEVSIRFEFAPGVFAIEAGEPVEVQLEVLFGALDSEQEGDTVQFGIVPSGIDAESDDDILATGSASSDEHTLRTQGLLISEEPTDGTGSTDSVQVVSGVDTDANYGTMFLEFEIAAFGDDLWLPAVSAVRGAAQTNAGVTYEILDQGTPTGDGVVSFHYDVEGADEDNGFFELEEGETYTMTVMVEAFNPTESSLYSFRLNSIGYSDLEDTAPSLMVVPADSAAYVSDAVAIQS